MATKPIKFLELHYTMTQFLIISHRKYSDQHNQWERNLFETTGTICFEGEGRKDAFASFCDSKGANCVESTGFNAVLFNGPNIATSGDGLNLVNSTSGKELFRPPAGRK